MGTASRIETESTPMFYGRPSVCLCFHNRVGQDRPILPELLGKLCLCPVYWLSALSYSLASLSFTGTCSGSISTRLLCSYPTERNSVLDLALTRNDVASSFHSIDPPTTYIYIPTNAHGHTHTLYYTLADT